ncbi:MAG: hypothetical protein GEEBNDBF_00944 [bacterium]|nr:hypothetical protein [bacterium]
MSQPQRLCWNCDAVVPGKVQFCPTCNALQKEMGAEMLAEPRVRGSVNMTSFFVGLVLLVVVVLGVGWYMTREKTPPAEVLPEGKSGWDQQTSRTIDSPNEITPAQRDVLPSGQDS